jgi:hypothetical protein
MRFGVVLGVNLQVMVLWYVMPFTLADGKKIFYLYYGTLCFMPEESSVQCLVLTSLLCDYNISVNERD